MKTITGETFGGEFIEYTIKLGKEQGNSAETEIEIKSVSLANEEPISIKIHGTMEREALAEALEKIAKELKNPLKNLQD